MEVDGWDVAVEHEKRSSRIPVKDAEIMEAEGEDSEGEESGRQRQHCKAKLKGNNSPYGQIREEVEKWMKHISK